MFDSLSDAFEEDKNDFDDYSSGSEREMIRAPERSTKPGLGTYISKYRAET